MKQPAAEVHRELFWHLPFLCLAASEKKQWAARGTKASAAPGTGRTRAKVDGGLGRPAAVKEAERLGKAPGKVERVT